MEPIPAGSIAVEVDFAEGPLGVVLRRRPEDGIIYVHDIAQDSQAVSLDVCANDEVWGVSDTCLGESSLDKEAWAGLVQFIKTASRPLKVVFRRRLLPACAIEEEEEEEEEEVEEEEEEDDDDEEDAREKVEEKRSEHKDSGAGRLEAEASNATSEEGESESESYQDLKSLLSRFFFKQVEAPTGIAGIAGFFSAGSKKSEDISSGGGHTKKPTPSYMLLKEGRMLIKEGEMSILVKEGLKLWATQSTRQFFLFNDLLIVTIPSPGPVLMSYEVESIIDLKTTKLHSSGQGFNGGADSPSASSSPSSSPSSSSSAASRAVFEILWPGGTLEIIANSKEEKEVWLLTLFLSICECVGDAERVLGWRHQYMLGTMHSAVISRDESRVRELIHECQNGRMEFSSIEDPDQDGFTPLHYSVMLRQTGITKALHEARADVTIADHRGLSPLHWAALQLDDLALSLLCCNIHDPDLFDNRHRTPLFLACVEGRNVSGKTDAGALRRCLSCLIALQADPNTKAKDSFFTPLQYLAASWQSACVDQLLDGSANVHVDDNPAGNTALHFAVAGQALKKAEGEGFRLMMSSASKSIENNLSSDDSSSQEREEKVTGGGVATLRSLLRAGAYPNKKNGLGKSVLHVLADEEFEWRNENLSEAVSLLVAFGARLDDSPQCQSLRQRCGASINFEALSERWSSSPAVNADTLGMTINCLEKPRDHPHGAKEGPTCLLCSAQFTLFLRQHHCRLCNALCCDTCSRRRATVEAKDVRVCDGCYNMVLSKVEYARQRTLSQGFRPLSPPPTSKSSPTSSSLAVAAVQATRNRTELFGGAPAGRAKAEASGGGGLESTQATLSEVADRLAERGEKLNRLNDKTADMSNAANEFANLAKKLNEQNRNRWF